MKGPTTMNDTKYNIKVKSSTIGAQAIGDHAMATGHVSTANAKQLSADSVSQDQFNSDVSAILHMLTDTTERLEAGQASLNQFIAGLYGVNVDGKTTEELVREIKAAITKAPKSVPERLKRQLEALAQGLASNAAFQLLQQALT